MSYAAGQPSYPPLHPYDLNPAAMFPPVPSAAPYPPPPSSVVIDFPQPYYLHHHHHHQRNPNNPSMLVGNPEQQEIHTIFVKGLPDDVKPREIHNLFSRRHGFDNCLLKYTGNGDQVVAFATFSNHQQAVATMNALNGVIFDPQSGATLHIELARSNTRKRPRGDGAYTIIDMRASKKIDDQENWSNDGDGGSDEPSGTENDNSSKGALAAVQSGEAATKGENARAKSNEQLEKPSAGDIPPCSTLFIANLGPTCTQEELKLVLSKYPGFLTLKMRGRVGMPVAFADFTDVESSTAAMTGLQDTLLGSSDRGGMHLEYARSKMRKK